MRTFSQLLTAYMERTGVSDSELARTLGVTRQTIFRWKEGLTARPRSREDVLHCAAKLRLNADERDELLLAAGFAPQTIPSYPPTESPTLTPVATSITTPPSPEPPPSIEIVSLPAIPLPVEISVPSPTWTLRRVTWRWWVLIVGILAMGIVAIAAWSRPTVSYPVAAPGEMLIVIANFDGAPLANDKPTRLQAALEREAQTLRRERTRVIVWPDAIRDAPAATQVLHRTNASIVIWGTVNGGRITAGVVMVGENWQTYERGLNTLLSAPANPRLTINTESVADAQAFALFTLAQWHLNHEELGFARATLAQALASSPSEPDALAALNFYSGLLHQLTNPPELATAIQFYSQTLDLQADWLEAYLNRGVAYVRLNQAQAWQRDFAQALALQSDHVGARLAFCWAHGLDNQPQAALPHCDVAVSRDNTARSREARAIAYAEAGRWSEASADLTAFLDWLAKQPERLRSAYSVTPSDWLQMIKAQQNPFSQHVLERLRTE